MRKELENILFDHLKTSLSAELKTMLVRGHTTDDRHIPYISIDVGEIKPFGDMLESDGIFEADVNVAIADSAHDIDYKHLFNRIEAVKTALSDFFYIDDNVLINALFFESETDARDDNNLGTVLTYKAIVQFI